MEKKKRMRKKAAAGIVSVLLVIVLLISGTLAWKDYSQHASNEFDGDGVAKKYIPHLVEDFDPVDDWHIVDGPITKEVRVRNLGGTENYPGEPWDYGEVYIRLQLKEYMEINATPDTYEYSADRLMIDTDGNFIRFDTEDEAEAEGYDKQNDLVKLAEYGDVDASGNPIERFYVKTKEGDPNGQYGRFLVLDIIRGDGGDMVSVVTGVERASEDARDKHNDWGKDDQDENKNGECDYTPHTWETNSIGRCGEDFHKYVRWNLSDSVISLEEWKVNDGELGEKWIVDGDTGWAYWAAPLRPGQTTANLLDSVSLIMDPPGKFYYTIHTDMEAVSHEDLWDGQTEMPKELWDKYEEAVDHPGGLTGTSADIGYVFVADGFEWRVLDVDEDRNIRIVTNKVIGETVWGSAAAYNTKDLEVKIFIENFYKGLDDLKKYNKLSGLTPTDQSDASHVIKVTTATTNGYVMLPMTRKDVELYLDDPSNWVAYDLDGQKIDYFLVTMSGSSIQYVNNNTATSTIGTLNSGALKTDVKGVRPSMFINVTDQHKEP